VFHVKHEGLAVASSALGLVLGEQALDALGRFERLLLERAVPEGLVSAGDAGRIRERHVMDCLRAVPLIPAGADRAYDLGSGAGLPGIVVAIARPDLQMALVEVRRHRVEFLESVSHELALANAIVLAVNAERLTEQVDVCLSRAFRGPAAAWAVAAPLLRPTGRLLYWAGRGVDVAAALPPAVSLRAASTPGSGDIVVVGGPA
jgi:16S rRNA (guanine527-N7)-methyltransferase